MTNRIPIPMSAAGDLPARYASISEVLQIAAAAEHAAARIEELEAEVERLTKKCDMQATILRRLTPETHPGTFFIYGTLGDKDQNGMPEKLMVIPTYGVDFSYIYVRAEKTTGPEW